MATATNPNWSSPVPVAGLNTELVDRVFAEIGTRSPATQIANSTPVLPAVPDHRAQPLREAMRVRAVATDDESEGRGSGRSAIRVALLGLMAAGGFMLMDRNGMLPTTVPASTTAARSEASAERPATKPIEDVEVGERLLGRNPLREQVDSDAPEPDPNTWRKLVLRMKKESGSKLSVNLLRPLEWIEDSGAKAGGDFFLNLPEMGAVGNAHVEAIEPCPSIERGPGNVVTGTFHHEADPGAVILHVEFSNGTILTGVTDNHPFWSEDRQDFVSVGELRKGNRVRMEDGTAAVTSVSSRLAYPGEMLYNVEIHNEHVYQVTTAGILVHNSCVVKKVVVDAERFPQSAAHLEEAGATGRPLTINRGAAAQNRADALGGRAKVPGMDLDEAPPAVLRQPGEQASVRPLPRGDNRGAGASIGNQMRGVPNGGQVIIVIEK